MIRTATARLIVRGVKSGSVVETRTDNKPLKKRARLGVVERLIDFQQRRRAVEGPSSYNVQTELYQALSKQYERS